MGASISNHDDIGSLDVEVDVRLRQYLSGNLSTLIASA
jgi:hypothetical protein